MVLAALDIFLRMASTVTLLVAVGLCVHGALGLHARVRAAVWLGVLLCVLAVLRLVSVHGSLVGGFGDAFHSVPFEWTWDAYRGWFWLTVAGGVSLALVSGIPAGWPLWVPALMLATTPALSGHVAASDGSLEGRLGITIHVLVAGFWFLAPLVLWPRQGSSDEDLANRAGRFGRFAIALVPALFVTGLALTWRLAGGPGVALSSLYGQLLVGKLALACVLLAIGGFNHLHVSVRLRASPDVGRALLRRTLGVDAVLFLMVALLISLATTITGPAG